MIPTSRILQAVFALVLPAVTANCAEPTNTLPIENFPAAVAWKQSAPADSGPAIVLDSSEPAPAGEVRLLLVNPTDQPIEYYGYTVGSWAEAPPAGEIHPFYRRETLNAAGEWQSEIIGRCGTGKGTIAVPPGHVGEFSADVTPNVTTRVGVNVLQTSATGTTIVELWSPAIASGSEKVPPQAP